MKKCGIYKITSPSGKVYIGQSRDIERRFRQYHKLNCKKQPVLYNSFIKHGVSNHVFEIIELCSEETLNINEEKYINIYSSYVNGLNCSLGGENIPSLLPEVKLKQSQTRKRKFADGTLINPMQGRVREKAGMFGKKHTSEAIEKLNQVKRVGTKNNKSRKVICSITKEVYQSARQAWLCLYSEMYSYNYFKCMLSGHNKNKTTLSYL